MRVSCVNRFWIFRKFPVKYGQNEGPNPIPTSEFHRHLLNHFFPRRQRNGGATDFDRRILPEKWVVRYVSIFCLDSWALLIQKIITAVALTVLLWDWAISLGDEVQYIWRCAAILNSSLSDTPSLSVRAEVHQWPTNGCTLYPDI